MKLREKILNIINNSKTFLILTHIGADADAIASSIAMYWFLVSLGKNPDNIEVYIPYVSKDLEFIDSNNCLKNKCTLKKYDLIIIVDCSSYLRVEGIDLIRESSTSEVIVIDHHEASENLLKSNYSIMDSTASSCTCIIYREFIDYINAQYTKCFAKCVGIGIYSDTIGLTINVTEECKSILEDCAKKSVDLISIKNQLQEVDERTKILTNLAIQRLVFKQGIGCTYILQEDLLENERNLRSINRKAIIEKILHSTNCSILILVIENQKHQFKGSLRTTLGNINLNDICVSLVQCNLVLEGGGHANSAGFRISIEDSITDSIENTYNIFIDAIIEKN